MFLIIYITKADNIIYFLKYFLFIEIKIINIMNKNEETNKKYRN